MRVTRRLAALAAAALVLAAAASARTPGVRIAFLPGHVLQGTSARVAVAVRPAGVACTLRVRYSSGATQTGLARVVALKGVASWTWQVPIDVQAGPARAEVRCGRAGTLTRSLVVVGRLNAPKVVVVKSGFSTRPSSGGSTRLSYGVLLHNTSDARDATDVTVQTNFVLADEHLLGTDTQRVGAVSAGADYAVGDTVTFPAAAPIARVEVVIRVGEFVPHTLHLPTLANMHLVPGLRDPAWLGSVEGEIQNTDPALTLERGDVSAIVLDAAGAILGGGSGYVTSSLPPGARAFLKISGAFDVIPADRAAGVSVSISPRWARTSG